MKALITMKWNEAKNQWHLLHGINGKFIQEVYDCANTSKFFEGLDKTKPKKYIVEIEPYNAWGQR